MTQSAAQTARLVREVDHPAVRVLYDQANLTFTHDEPYEEALRIQGDLVGHVHVKDLVFTDPDAPFQASETARVAASNARYGRASSATASSPGPTSSRPSPPSATTMCSRSSTNTVGTRRICRSQRSASPGPRQRSAPSSPSQPPRRARHERAGQDPRRHHRCGNIATIAQLPTLVKRDDVELAALVSRRPDPGPLMRRWGFRAAYRTVEDMLSAQNLDAVFVLTPRSNTRTPSRLVGATWTCFCEKPLAPSADEARTPRRPRRPARPPPDGRLQPPLRPGVRGRARGLRVGRRDVLRRPEEPAGLEYRATFENAIHMVDLLRWYCGGDPVDVAHTAGEDPWQEDGTAAIIRFDTGNTGVLMAARTAGAWNETRRLRRRTYRRSAGARIGLDHRRRRHHHPQPQLRGLWMGNGD